MNKSDLINEKRMPKIQGLIIPSIWDEKGSIKAVSLHTSDEREYRVEYGGVGKELLAHIHHKVEVTGKISERLDGHQYISVHSYSTLCEPPEEMVAET